MIGSVLFEEFQDVEEDLNDIDVKKHGCEVILIDGQLDSPPSHDHLGVNHQIYPE